MPLHRSLDAAVRSHASLRPEAPALLGPVGAACSYRQLAEHLERVNAVLAQQLPAENAIIAVGAVNGPELFTAIVAAMASGTCAPFDSRRPPAEVDEFLTEVGPALVLADDAAIQRHRDVFERHGAVVVRMVASPTTPGLFDVDVIEPRRRRVGEGISGQDRDIALLLRTSGTTATAKIVPHTETRMLHVFNSIVRAVELEATDRCVGAMPLYHVHGVSWVIGASLIAGASVVCPANIDAATLADALRVYKPTWFTASPPVHRDVLAYLRREGPLLEPSLRFIRTLATPIEPQFILDLEAALGAPVLDGYGSTEAPVSTLTPLRSVVKKPGSVGLPIECELAIFDGRVAIRGENIAPSYAGSAGRRITDPDSGWYLTEDAGYLDAEGYLYVTGRLDERINVGGDKVAPGIVDTALRAHHAVVDAVAFPLPHPTLGQHVAAAVVLRPGATVSEMELFEHARGLLPRSAVPNVVHRVPVIVRDTFGKVRRHELTEMFARDPDGAGLDAERSKENSLLHTLTHIWENVLEYAPVALDENFFAAGGDSLRAIRVMMLIEAELGVAMSMDTLLFAPTIHELADAVIAQANNANPTRLRALRTSGSRPPLIFFDGDVDGGGLYARFLPAALDSEQPIYVVRPNGALGDRIPESVEVMAEADAAMIAAEVPSAVYRLAGYCSGGPVAFEVARHLEKAGKEIDIVTLIASAVPNARLEKVWAFSHRGGTRVYRYARRIVNTVRTGSILTELRHVCSAVAAGACGLLLGVARENTRRPWSTDLLIYSDRLTRYFPKRWDRSIDLIWAHDDPPAILGDPSMGWGYVAQVRRHFMEGDHTTMLTDHVDELGAALRRICDAADERRAYETMPG